MLFLFYANDYEYKLPPRCKAPHICCQQSCLCISLQYSICQTALLRERDKGERESASQTVSGGQNNKISRSLRQTIKMKVKE